MCQIGREQSKAFSRLIKQIMLRRNNDVIAAYLPAKLDACIFCTLTDEQKELYMQARNPGLRHSTPRQLGPLHTIVPAQVVREGRRTYDGTYSSAFQTVTTLKKIVNDPEVAKRALNAPPQPQATFLKPLAFSAFTEPDEEAPMAAAGSSQPKPAAAPKVPPNPDEALRLSGKLQVLLSMLLDALV